MSISSITFIGIFLPIIIGLYNLPIIKGIKGKNILLLSASLFFYGCAEPIYILFLVSAILLNYYAVILDLKIGRNFFGNIIVAIDVLTLLFFKYINSLLVCMSVFGLSDISILFPIGLSFYTFKEISFVIESRRNLQLNKHLCLLNVSLYISNFMTLVAGPISFYDSEIVQIAERKNNRNNVYQGAYRFSIGLAKKILIADSLKVLVDACFSIDELSVAMSWLGAIAYTLQLYMDFSGYTDMAIGLGMMFGFCFPENFNYPYIATSISDFWKRWHMSLTKWLTRYVYFPLGGSRVNTVARHIFNLFVVWLCTGMWHGSNWTFIIWGMVYFILQVIEKYSNFADYINRLHLGYIYTIVVVIILWVIFRSDSVYSALAYVKTMFGFSDAALFDSEFVCQFRYYIIPLVVSILLSCPLRDSVRQKCEDIKPFRVFVQVCVFILFVASVVVLFSRGFTAPLYANF